MYIYSKSRVLVHPTCMPRPAEQAECGRAAPDPQQRAANGLAPPPPHSSPTSARTGLPNCRRSVADHVVSWCICDTGSTDATRDVVAAAFGAAGVPGHLANHTWINFAKSRNACLREAEAQLAGRCDYFLLLDADHEADPIRGFDLKSAALTADGYMLREKPAPGRTGTVFENLRLVRVGLDWEYIGSTHEYLWRRGDLGWVRASLRELPVTHHADGGSRGDKFERDRKLLEAEVAESPHNSRARFYLANTYRDLGDCGKAIGECVLVCVLFVCLRVCSCVCFLCALVCALCVQCSFCCRCVLMLLVCEQYSLVTAGVVRKLVGCGSLSTSKHS